MPAHPLEAVFSAIAATRDVAELVAAYGVILYDREHNALRAIASQDAQLSALNALSGERWILFFGQLRYNESLDAPLLKKLREKLPDSVLSFGLKGFTQTVPMPGGIFSTFAATRNAKEAYAHLGINKSADLPCILLLFPFSEVEAYAIRVPLKISSTLTAFDELSAEVSFLRELFDDISSKNLKNAEGLYHEVGRRLTDRKITRILLAAKPIFNWLLGKLKSAAAT